MIILTGTRITRKLGNLTIVAKPKEPSAVISLYPFKVKTIMAGVLAGNLAGTVRSILYVVMR